MTRPKGSKNKPKADWALRDPNAQELADKNPNIPQEFKEQVPSIVIDGLGASRPQLPESVVKDLKIQVQALEQSLAAKADPYEELKQLAEIIRVVQRAVKELSADDDIFQGLINVQDIRERTRLTETGLLSHSAMRVAADLWPEFTLYGKIANMEDPYYISEEGEGRREGILLQQARSKLDANLVLNMPNTRGPTAEDPEAPGSKPPGKKSIVQRILHR